MSLMENVELPFDPPLPPPDGLSKAARRTRDQRAALAAGRHPLAGGAHRTDDATCGNCRFHEVVARDGADGGGTIHHVCALASGDSLAAITIRLRWPGCDRWGEPC